MYIYRLRNSAAKVFDRGGYAAEIGELNIFDGKLDAISSIFRRIDKNICAHCDKRIFLECETIDKMEPEPEPKT